MELRSKALFPTAERGKRALWLKKAAPALDAAEKQLEVLLKERKSTKNQMTVLAHQFADLEEAYGILQVEFAEYKEKQNYVNTNTNNEAPPGSADSD